MNVLVLGVGGVVSQGIVKVLRSTLDVKIIGACVDQNAAGFQWCDKTLISPYAHDHNFMRWLKSVCTLERVEVILSGVEEVLLELAKNRDELPVCIVSDQDSLITTQDKLRTAWWLRGNDFNYPITVTDKTEVAPMFGTTRHLLIAKQRKGKGSAGLITITNQAELDYALTKTDYIYQEYLKGPEYTVATWSDRAGQVRGCITFRRTLKDGTTVYAEAVDEPTVRDEAIRIATALQPMGPCNIQMKLTERGPVCFEINNRFSGTTPIRARLGWNDVEATLRHYVLGEEARDMSIIMQGRAVRYWAEWYP
jgi:carbamoyl-phosphate synthase large subunit